MRFLLVIALSVFSVPAAAADWVLVWQRDAQLNTAFHYVDRSSIRESSGHKLVWVKHTTTWKSEKNPSEQPNGLYLYEFDCAGSVLTHKAFDPSGSENVHVSQKWELIVPDKNDGLEEAAQAVCGK